MIRRGNIEFRYSATNQRHEIVVWSNGDNEYCYVAAYFVRDSEGYSVASVGSRLMNGIDEYKEFFPILKFAHSYLDALFVLGDNLT